MEEKNLIATISGGPPLRGGVEEGKGRVGEKMTERDWE